MKSRKKHPKPVPAPVAKDQPLPPPIPAKPPAIFRQSRECLSDFCEDGVDVHGV